MERVVGSMTVNVTDNVTGSVTSQFSSMACRTHATTNHGRYRDVAAESYKFCRLYPLSPTDLVRPPRCPYAMSGTDVRYAATPGLCDTRY
eukprot:1030269-Rhodomonas_salina.1